VHGSTLLCSTTNPISNYHYAVSNGANANNIEPEERERKRVKWYRRGAEGVEKKKRNRRGAEGKAK
jgi:hypothetical protein